ncbi:type 1 glutamine amidotransferase domain-containing protein [Bdellovibrio sp. KM01]|uniref:type 1 glutamine amidotransferase domain-containing protein n=1 Tax=Bdellovibrio sp. KM01 TaxID=2748865 RepID=UPI0015EA8638|nr:type 1 glutamine amidotransferase domain-containing protein [Bdellovibrio sp. KM01]QLY26833.1 type 1 glutamine amidotransferase domain-containing protein [Bdellovibrio sp. KM01]
MKSKKVLFVATNCNRLGDTGLRTGAFLSELTHPYQEIQAAGYEIDIASPLGGEIPLDGVKMDDPINAVWMNDEDFLEKVAGSLSAEEVRPENYCAIFFAGGHGAMFDLPQNKKLQEITSEIWEHDGVVAAVCHGAAGLVNVKTSQGVYLIKDHEVAAFSNSEEEAVGMENVVPFLLQDKIQFRGATYTHASKFAAHVVKSGRLVTGQNPASAMGVGQSVVEVLEFIEDGREVPAVNWCEWHVSP